MSTDLLEKSAESKTPTQPKRPKVSYKASPRVLWADRVAKWLICGFGSLVLFAIALIILFVGREAAPLFYTPKSSPKPSLSLHLPEGKMLSWNLDEFQVYSYGLASNGHFYLVSNKDGSIQQDLAIQDFAGQSPVTVWSSSKGDYVIAGTSTGKIKIFGVQFMDGADGVSRSMQLKESPLLDVFPSGTTGTDLQIDRVTGSFNNNAEILSVAVWSSSGRLFAGSYRPMPQALELKELRASLEGKVTGMVVDSEPKFLTLTTDANWLYRWDISGSELEPVQQLRPSFRGSYVSSMQLLIGDFTHILGFADGSVEAWFGVRENPQDSEFKLTKIRSFEKHSGKVEKIVVSPVDRGFWTVDERGQVRMHFNPSGRKLFTFELGKPVAGISPSSHLNGVNILTADSVIQQWELNNPHPDINLSVLFGKIWYEGYDHAQYNWQSSSGSDNFEAKFSLVPLMIGTLKGAFYGLIFAIPIAVLAALYTSQLMSRRMRSFIKPTIEIMAALPSVVIGFLAGLWIAPWLEKNLLAFSMVVPLFLALVLIAAWFYFRIPLKTRNGIPQEAELGIMLGIAALSMVVAQFLAAPIEQVFFHGNIQQWIYDTTGQKVEQRNSILIGLAMGFAVIPIIFTVSEDAMSNVPRHYVSGSLALGATRWQSAVRVVVPTASPGIFSAIMLGFGRAVGETMIVLMATGNTPIMSFSPLNGMRTLAANIAVEVPEAPYQGSLYRVLFLGAVLLFILTFIVNTLAEVVRLRLRERYRAL